MIQDDQNKPATINAPKSTALQDIVSFVHLANISYRTGRSLRLSQSSGHFLDAPDANALLTRDYRTPYTVPEQV